MIVKDEVARAVLSTNVRELLKARGWSNRELARRTGDAIMTLQGLINGDSLPRAGVLIRVAKAFEISLDELTDVDLPEKLSAAAH